MAARAEVEPTTLRLKAIDSTKAPPCPTCGMFTITVLMDDHKLSQESNLTARQPRRAPIPLYISFNKCRRLANERLVNLMGDTGRKLGSQAPPHVIHYSTSPPPGGNVLKKPIPLTQWTSI